MTTPMISGAEPVFSSLLLKMSACMKESADRGEYFFTFPDNDEDTGVLPTQVNVMYFLNTMQIDLGFDEFALKIHVFGVPHSTFLDDACFDELYVAMDHVGLRLPKDHLWSLLRVFARSNRVHPVRDKLAKLQDAYDKVPRLDTWLIDYCGAEDTPYVRAVSAAWMIAAVRRVRQPGCKFDTILVLEGEQGTMKSTALKELAYGDWFTDSLTIGLDQKEVIELMQGYWIAELAELANIGKKDVEAVKTFAARQTDKARMSYARETSAVPRQFVLAATTNKAKYLRDETGDRRFWPVETKPVSLNGEKAVTLNIEGLKGVVDQLWAEAATREAAGEAIHLSPEIEEMARAEQASRYDADERQQLLEDLLEGKTGMVPNDQLYHALGYTEIRDRHTGVSKPVTAAMKRLGWKAAREWMGSGPTKKQHRVYKSPGYKGDDVLILQMGSFMTVHKSKYGRGHPANSGQEQDSTMH